MTDAMHRVLLIEDDPAICDVLETLFEGNGFRAAVVGTCRAAATLRPAAPTRRVHRGSGSAGHGRTALHPAGENLVRRSDHRSDGPNQEPQRLAAFEAGADDYIIKPFSGLELLARVRSITRRLLRRGQPEALLRLGDVEIDLEKRVTIGPGGEVLKLTPLEHRILECLAQHSGRLVTHEQIMDAVWGPRQADVRSLRVYVASLRRKLEKDPAQPQYILTEVGVGYRLVPDEPEVRTSP